MSGSYDVGDLVRMRGLFKDEDGVPVGPTGVRFLVKNSTGIVVAYTTATTPRVIADSSDAFHLDVTADMSGKWYYRSESSTGADGQAAEESWFKVLKQQVST